VTCERCHARFPTEEDGREALAWGGFCYWCWRVIGMLTGDYPVTVDECETE